MLWYNQRQPRRRRIHRLTTYRLALLPRPHNLLGFMERAPHLLGILEYIGLPTIAVGEGSSDVVVGIPIVANIIRQRTRFGILFDRDHGTVGGHAVPSIASIAATVIGHQCHHYRPPGRLGGMIIVNGINGTSGR